MGESGDADNNYVVDVAGAVLLGLFTCMAAFAAYQASLWGGNQATAYTSAINILGEANRELLRGVQDQAFDTTLWIEQMKASDAANAAADDDDDDDDDDEPSVEERARTLAAELAYSEDSDEPIARRLSRALQSRRELVAALKWSEEQHQKRTRQLPPQRRLELAGALIALFDKSEDLDDQYDAVLKEQGLDEDDEEELALRLDKDPALKQRVEKLEQDSLATQAAIDAEMDKLASPMFFESPTYVRTHENKYKTLLASGQQTFLDGQQYNANGDRFTLATVFYTVALFFAGLSAVLRRRGIKVAFLGLSVLVASGALVYMLGTPFA